MLKNQFTKLSLIFAFLVIFSTNNSVFSQIPTNGLVGYYPFNGNANDESSNSNNGTVSGASLSSDRFSKTNKAYSFNGFSSYISLPNTYDFMPRSINFWFKATDADYSDWVSVFTSDNPNLNKGLVGVLLKKINGKYKMQMGVCNVLDTFDITLNTWHNINIYSGSDNSIKFYLNGQLLSSYTRKSYLTSVDGLNKIIIGATRSAASRFFTGQIDDIRVYDRELTSTEISQIYNYTLNNEELTFKNNINVFPNPTDVNFTIDFGDISNIQNYKIKITNTLGQTVFENEINQQICTVDISNWTTKGLYLLYIVDPKNNIIEVKKLIVN